MIPDTEVCACVWGGCYRRELGGSDMDNGRILSGLPWLGASLPVRLMHSASPWDRGVEGGVLSKHVESTKNCTT